MDSNTFGFLDDVMYKSNGVYTKDGKDVYKLIRECVHKQYLVGLEEIDIGRLNNTDRAAALNIFHDAMLFASDMMARLEENKKRSGSL